MIFLASPETTVHDATQYVISLANTWGWSVMQA